MQHTQNQHVPPPRPPPTQPNRTQNKKSKLIKVHLATQGWLCWFETLWPRFLTSQAGYNTRLLCIVKPGAKLVGLTGAVITISPALERVTSQSRAGQVGRVRREDRRCLPATSPLARPWDKAQPIPLTTGLVMNTEGEAGACSSAHSDSCSEPSLGDFDNK